MKKALFVAAVVTLSIMMVGSAFALIGGSKHDFNAMGYGFAASEICKPCHTPHNAVAIPLWSHSLSAGGWTAYGTGYTMNATAGTPSVTSISGLCLSCHDNSVALGAFIGKGSGNASTISQVGTGSASLGMDLSNDHPIEFTYDAALVTADGELHSRAALDANLVFNGDTMTCATCHDPHNTPGNSTLLNLDNTGSALCLECHNK